MMASFEDTGSATGFSISSSVKDDVWHPGKGASGYEWWYFDALSDNGREAIVIIFLDNFVFSPRYNTLNRKAEMNGSVEGAEEAFPAVAFFYYKDGKPIFRCINEYRKDEFSADPEWPHCEIGGSSFRYEKAPYGEGYKVDVSAPVRGGKELSAQFEWLAVESDLAPDMPSTDPGSHVWNLVSPRSDVTGKVIIKDRSGKEAKEVSFRGTGYHDHNLDRRWPPAAISCWSWGRIHFADATAVYYDFRGPGERDSSTNLIIVNEDGLETAEARIETGDERRNIFGLKSPAQLRFDTEAGARLSVTRKAVLDASFFYDRYMLEAVLTLPGGIERRSFGLGEHLAPWKLKRGMLDRLIDMRIGRGWKSAFLP